MFKTLIYGIKQAKRMEKAKFNLGIEFNPGTPIDLDGKLVYHSNTVIDAHAGMFALLFHMTDGTTRVFVDDRFLTLPKPVQLFIYHHELGHVFHNHREDTKARLKAAKRGEVYINEVEADQYAAGKVGLDEAVAALFYLEARIRKETGKCHITKQPRDRAQALLANN